MISELLGDPDATAALYSFLACVGASFCLGVLWSAYRAIGWVEGIRRWAYGLVLDSQAQTETCGGICCRQLETMGEN